MLCWAIERPGTRAAAARPAAAAATQPTPARTRIALLNLTYVIKNYDKYKHFQEEIKGIVEPFQTKDADLRHQLEELRKKVEAAPGQREEMRAQGQGNPAQAGGQPNGSQDEAGQAQR